MLVVTTMKTLNKTMERIRLKEPMVRIPQPKMTAHPLMRMKRKRLNVSKTTRFFRIL